MIVMVRHGETDWNHENRFQGHADPPLNEAGRMQARELAAALALEPKLTALYSSPLRRAKETADIIARELGLDVHATDALKEVDVGSWSGLTRTEVEARYPEGYRRWLEYDHGWDDGETYADLQQRVLEGLRGIAVAHPGERVLTVTHGGPIRSALAASEGASPDENIRSRDVIGNCAIVRFAIRDGAVQRVD